MSCHLILLERYMGGDGRLGGTSVLGVDQAQCNLHLFAFDLHSTMLSVNLHSPSEHWCKKGHNLKGSIKLKIT